MTVYAYNDADEVTQVTAASGTSLAQAAQRIGRDTFGRVTTLTDANNNATTYGYDGFDRPRRTTYPDGSYEAVEYDARGQVTSTRLRDGNQLGYDVDALGRLRGIGRPGTVVNETNQAFDYDDLGRLSAAYDSAGRYLFYQHDALGRVTAEQGAGNTVGGTMTFDYDLAGRRTSLAWADGVSVTAETDALGRLVGALGGWHLSADDRLREPAHRPRPMSLAMSAAADAPLGDAVAWVAGVLTGGVATSVAVLAVAVTGLLMLRGRLPVRRGATVVIGCFVLFSAATIANGILTGVGQAEAPAPVAVTAPAYTPVAPPPPSSDPYAGVAVPEGR